MNGIIVRKLELSGSEGTQKVYVGDLPKGFYVLEVGISGMIYRTKLIIQ